MTPTTAAFVQGLIDGLTAAFYLYVIGWVIRDWWTDRAQGQSDEQP